MDSSNHQNGCISLALVWDRFLKDAPNASVSEKVASQWLLSRIPSSATFLQWKGRDVSPSTSGGVFFSLRRRIEDHKSPRAGCRGSGGLMGVLAVKGDQMAGGSAALVVCAVLRARLSLPGDTARLGWPPSSGAETPHVRARRQSSKHSLPCAGAAAAPGVSLGRAP